VTSACDVLPRRATQKGCSRQDRWSSTVDSVEPDPRYTVVYLRVDPTSSSATTSCSRGSISIQATPLVMSTPLTPALDLATARRLSAGHHYPLGDSIPAWATVTCLCRPLRPDSVVGRT